MQRFSSPVSAVYAWNAWGHDPLCDKMVAFSDSDFPTEAQVTSNLVNSYYINIIKDNF